MKLGSLFSGIGGLDLGVEAATGARTVWQVERDEWCRGILARHWPDAVRYDDVCKVGEELERVDIIAGGFPCQDVSVAGKRAGLTGGQRSGLWREYARIVRVVRPRFVFVENVAGLLSMEFGHVLGDLAALGYDAEWAVFRASDAGAPHRRERVFVLAMADACGDDAERLGGPSFVDGSRGAAQGEARERQRRGDTARGGSEDRGVADAAVLLRDGCDDHARRGREGVNALPQSGNGRHDGNVADALCAGLPRHGRPSGTRQEYADHRVDGRRCAEPRVGRGADGLSHGLDAHRWPAGRGEAQHEWESPHVAQGVHERRQRLKALGNAVVPQQAALAWRVLSARFAEVSQ